ncbi:vegetative cell wall protein gp1-like [Sus scrofa]|uniref:vegetative cell wall protein gp1-like n=1 Tax=Sus scrofa TaxID=9823 RepID=UPI000A2B26BC|nr:vegetative cell wall protein gp1-like [Sus scrofa]
MLASGGGGGGGGSSGPGRDALPPPPPASPRRGGPPRGSPPARAPARRAPPRAPPPAARPVSGSAPRSLVPAPPPARAARSPAHAPPPPPLPVATGDFLSSSSLFSRLPARRSRRSHAPSPLGPLRARGAPDPTPTTQGRSLCPGDVSSQTGQCPSASSRRSGVAPEMHVPTCPAQVLLKPWSRSPLNSAPQTGP